MSTSDKLKKLMTDLTDELLTEKEEEIKRLTAANEKLREENDRLKQQAQYKAPDQFTPNRNIELTRKAADLRKAIDEFLGQEAPNRRTFPPTFTPISIPNPGSDVIKSTSTGENSKSFRSSVPGDDTLVNGTMHNGHSFQEDFGTRQDFRPETDTDIINAATEMRPTLPYHHQQGHNGHSHNGHNSFVPGLNNINNSNNGGRRFQSMNGLNNPRRNHNNINNNNNNNNGNNNINNNNNNNINKYTIFIAWSGSVSTVDQVRELFDPNDVIDIRYTSPKQFAHVDLKTEIAMNKAMLLNGQTKSDTQGMLRVETGKPRSSNTTENGQRQQNQPRNNFNNNRPNNKNINGFNNNGLQKKYNPNYNNNRNNNNNNNGGPYQQSFNIPSVEKENGTSTPADWQFAANSSLSSVSNQETKPSES